MKDLLSIFLIIFVTMTMFISMMFFAEEVVVQQEAIHIRNRVIEILEIEGGYTSVAKSNINSIIQKSKRNIIVNVNKEGKLSFGEKIKLEVAIYYNRRLPFMTSNELIKYSIFGEYYNINGWWNIKKILLDKIKNRLF